MKELKRKNNESQRILVNQLDYELDLSKFNESYRILRFRPQSNDHHLSAYETVRHLPEGMVKSVYRHSEKVENKFENWYYLLVTPEYLKDAIIQLDKASGGDIYLKTYEIPSNRNGELVVLNLLLNSLRLNRNNEQSNICKSCLTLLRSDNFGVKCSDKEIITMEINITDEGCLHAHSVTYKEYHPGKGKNKTKDPSQFKCFYYVDGLEMTLSRTAPDNWKKLYEKGSLKIYVTGSLKKHKKHVIPQFNMGMDSLDCNKSAILYHLKRLLKRTYPDIIKHLKFSSILTTRTSDDYEKKANLLVTDVLKGCTITVTDPIDTTESHDVLTGIEHLLSTFETGTTGRKKGEPEALFNIVHDNKADCILRLTTAKPDDDTTPDPYLSREYPELNGSGCCIQHLSLDQDYLNKDFQKAAFGRILKELVIKRIIATRQLPEEVTRLYAGWSFAIARKVSDREYMGMTIHVKPDGKLLPGRLNQFWDVPKGTPRQHSNLLSATHARALQQVPLPPNYPGQEQYYAVSTGYNSYHICYSDRQSLPEYEELKAYYVQMDERPVWTANELIDIIGGHDSPDIDTRILNHIKEKKEYIVEDVRRLSNWMVSKEAVKEGFACSDFKEKLLDITSGQALYSNIKQRDKVDRYFGGLVDIHHWEDADHTRCYVSTESGVQIDIVTAKVYNGLPHVRAVIPIQISHSEEYGKDFEAILEGLKFGFGKSHHGSVLPLPFKILEELCELYALREYGLHWSNMTPKAYKKWNESKALDFFGEASI